MLEIHNSLNLFMQTLNVNEVCWVRVNSRNLGLTQTWENNTKGPYAKRKWNMTPLFWVDLNGVKIAWYSACLLLLFLFRTNGKKGHLDKNDFRYCSGNFFSKVAFWKVTWSQLCSKFLLNKYEALWQQHFERYPTVIYFTDME